MLAKISIDTKHLYFSISTKANSATWIFKQFWVC